MVCGDFFIRHLIPLNGGATLSSIESRDARSGGMSSFEICRPEGRVGDQSASQAIIIKFSRIGLSLKGRGALAHAF